MNAPTPSFFAVADLPLAEFPNAVHVPPLAQPFDAAITPPGSKSLTNRALLLAALADGTSTLTNALVDADDTRVMITALRQLGAEIRAEGATLHIRGVAGRWRPASGSGGETLDLENAGTAVRFLTAAAILALPGSGPITIDGNARMRERPIAGLVDLLRTLGAAVEYAGNPGFPPVRVHPVADLQSLRSTLLINSTASSQFISALLLIAPFLPNGLAASLLPPVTSESYVNMTLRLLESLGIVIKTADIGPPGGPRQRDIRINPGRQSASSRSLSASGLAAFELDIEPDATSATYLWAAAVLANGSRTTTPGLGPASLQADAAGFLNALRAMGAAVETACADSSRIPRPAGMSVRSAAALRPIDLDCSNIPDAAMTLAVLACFATPWPADPAATSTLRGLRTLRVKESDRLAALQAELTKLGATVEILTTRDDEALRITPPPRLPSPAEPLVFETYDDHRMAMSLALIGLRVPNVVIRNPACVGKTYPTFWRDLAGVYTPAGPTQTL
ncbi:MAG: 3-phosphoshikimate 1-carboxyvinyltransferase [Phycisphaeraceae bacterium]|nr:3-phosphoshikimate 1-carboxyvinyltransferase [Phycisphaeraceae bacterium]